MRLVLKNTPRGEMATKADVSGPIQNPQASTWDMGESFRPPCKQVLPAKNLSGPARPFPRIHREDLSYQFIG